MMLSKVLFSSENDNWSTPQNLFDELNKEFHFTLDACADEENHKCDKFYTKEDDGLKIPWDRESVFVNPPYGRQIYKWVQKCYYEGKKKNTIVVLLIPSRTDTKYFHDYILNKAEIRFIKGRLKFGNCKNAAPFPSLIAVFGGKENNDGQSKIQSIPPNEIQNTLSYETL